MNDELLTQIQTHDALLGELVDATQRRDNLAIGGGLVALVGELVTELPLVGKLARAGYRELIARSAQGQLDAALARLRADDAAEAQRQAVLSPPSAFNPHVPAKLDRFILAALIPDPQKRWQNAGDFADALDKLATQAGLAVEDADVSAWVMNEFGAPSRQKIRARTADIEQDVDLDIEQTFARVRARTEPIG